MEARTAERIVACQRATDPPTREGNPMNRLALGAAALVLLAVPVGAQAAGFSGGKAKVDTSTVGKQPAGTGVGRKGH